MIGLLVVDGGGGLQGPVEGGGGGGCRVQLRGAGGCRVQLSTQVQVDSLFLALLGPVMDSRPDKNLQAPDAVPDEAIRQRTSITFS